VIATGEIHRSVAPIAPLTGVRAFAAFWVMLLHLQFGLGIAGRVDLGSFINHGFWAVDVFFVLSGFILSLLYASKFEAHVSPAEYVAYLGARFARIYPLHLLSFSLLAAYFAMRLAAGEISSLPEGFNLRNAVLNLTLLHGWGYAQRLSWNYPSWSIGTEWFAYLLLLPLFLRGLRRLGVIATLGAALAVWSVLYWAVHRQAGLIGELAESWAPLRIVAEFLLGYALFRMYRVGRPSPWISDVLMLVATGGLIALSFAPDGAEWFLGPLVCALLFSLSRAGPLGRALFGNRIAVFWGERSYSIYMLHAVVQIFANGIYLHLPGVPWSARASYAFLALQAAVTMLAAHLVYGGFELPARERLRSLIARISIGAAPGGAPLGSEGQAP